MDKGNEPERIQLVSPEKQRTARRRELLFSGQTSEQFQQEVRNATSSLEGRTVSEQEVLSGDHSHISEVPSIYPVYHQALGNYKCYRVASGNPTTDDYAFIDCMAGPPHYYLLHFTNDPDSDRFPSLDLTTGRTKYMRIGRSHRKDDWFWLPSSHQEAQKILRGSNQQMQEGVQAQHSPMADLDPVGLSPREANLTEQDESQVALSPENSPIRPGTERQKTASQKRREFTSQEPEPSAHPTEMRPTKKRKAITNQETSRNQPDVEVNRAFGEAEPSRPRTYEEWKASAEGQNPNLKPVRSPGGRIYGYDQNNFKRFEEKTKMQERPEEDKITEKQLYEIVRGAQIGAGKGKEKWTSPEPTIQQKLQKRLEKKRETEAKSRVENKKEISNKWKKKFEELKANSEEYEEFKRRGAERQRKSRKKRKDPEFFKAFLEKKYQKEKENHDIAMYQLKTRMNNASPSQQEELQNAEQDLISQWDTFQKRYQADQERLKQLSKQRDLRQKYNEIEGELETMIKKYLVNDDKLELRDREDDLLNKGTDLSPHEQAFEEAESSRPRSYEQWKNSDEGQDPRLEAISSPGGRIYGYNPEDFEGFRKETKMQERPDKDRIEKESLDRVIKGKQLGAGKGKKKWTSPNPDIQGTYRNTRERITINKRERRKIIKENPNQHREYLANILVDQLMKSKRFKKDPEYRKSRLQKLMEEPEKCKAFFVKFLDKGYKRKKEQYNDVMYKIDTMIENVSTSQQDGSGSNSEYRKKVLQKVKQKLESRWNDFQKHYQDQADLKKLDKLIHQLEQLQRAPEQAPSPSERDRSSNEQRKQLQRASEQAPSPSERDRSSNKQRKQLQRAPEQAPSPSERDEPSNEQRKQLQRASEQVPSPSERDEPSNEQRDLQQRQQYVAIGRELGELIQRYENDDDGFDISKLNELELYDFNNLDEHEFHALENNLLNNFNL